MVRPHSILESTVVLWQSTSETSTSSQVLDASSIFSSARLAEKILFVGKAVHIVRRSSSADWRSQSQENMYAKMFLSLRDHPQLRIMDLEQAVDRVQNFMATQLLQLILLEGHLGGAALGLHLNALRDTFLLGDGHFFSVFIESSLDVMKRAATHHSERDLNLGAWRHACTCGFFDSLSFELLNTNNNNNNNTQQQQQHRYTQRTQPDTTKTFSRTTIGSVRIQVSRIQAERF